MPAGIEQTQTARSTQVARPEDRPDAHPLLAVLSAPSPITSTAQRDWQPQRK